VDGSRTAAIDQHLAQGRHRRAFDLIVPEFQDRVFRLAYSMLRDRGAAEDASQETFVRVWKALPKFDGRAALGTWIYAIARNTCLMEIRRRKPVVSMDDPDSAVAAAVEIATATPQAAYPERRLEAKASTRSAEAQKGGLRREAIFARFGPL